MEGMFFYAAILVIMGVLGWFRRQQEAKADQRRMDAPKTSIEDLPEATRRQLYGESRPVREARPAQRTSQSSAPPAIPTARPRQQQAPARRQATPQQRTQQQPARRQQPTSAPQQRQAHQPTMQRMRSALEHMAESVQEQMDQMEGRPAAPPPPPPARRRKGKSPEQLAVEQRKRHEQARQKRKAEAARATRRREIETAVMRKPSTHLLGTMREIRRGIILAEVLGTPKGFEF